MRITRSARTPAAALLAAAVVMSAALASCGDGQDTAGSESRSPSQPPGAAGAGGAEGLGEVAEPKVEDAVATARTWLRAFFDGNAELACSLQTEHYIEASLRELQNFGVIKKGASCEDGVDATVSLIRAVAGKDFALDEVTVFSKSDDGRTVMLEVTYKGVQSGPVEHYQLKYDDRQWIVTGDDMTLADK